MAGDWIKVRKNLPADPRVVRISSALKADRLRTVGALIVAWGLFDDHTEDGRLDGYTPDLFDELVGVTGLSNAMAAVGWLEIGDGFLAAPRFDEHNGQSSKRRAQDAVRKASSREADACPLPKRTKSGPEKRREERVKVNKKRGTIEEISAYAVELGLPATDGESCFLRWEGNGWTNKGEPVKDWRATLRNWKLQNFLPSQRGVTARAGTMHPPTEDEIRVGWLIGRTPTDQWSDDESAALRSIGTVPPADLELLEDFYGAEIHPTEDHRVKSIASLLANWNREKDKARVWRDAQP